MRTKSFAWFNANVDTHLLHIYSFDIIISFCFHLRIQQQAYQMTSDILPHGINSIPIVSSRNTSIPHPLPQNVTGKHHGNLTDLYLLYICMNESSLIAFMWKQSNGNLLFSAIRRCLMMIDLFARRNVNFILKVNLIVFLLFDFLTKQKCLRMVERCRVACPRK